MKHPLLRHLPQVAICMLLVVALSVVPAPPVHAATRTWLVTNINDSGAGSLRRAINDAMGTSSTDVNIINFALLPSVSYPITISLQTPLPAIDHGSVVINGPGTDILTVSGNDSVSVFSVATCEFMLRDLTVARGQAPAREMGGGLKADRSSVGLDGVVFDHNSALEVGGAVYAIGSTLAVTDSIFSANQAREGGAIAVDAMGRYPSTINLRSSSFSDNQAELGGAISSSSVISDATLEIEQCSFSGNEASEAGGAVFNHSETTGGQTSITVHASQFTGNVGGTSYSDSFIGGAAIYNDAGTLTVSESTFSENIGMVRGAVFFDYADPGSLTIDKSSFEDNRAIAAPGAAAKATGSALYIAAGHAAVTNSTFAGNIAHAAGSIFNHGTLELTNCTLTNNRAGSSAGGLLNSGTATVTNCTIAENEAPLGANLQTASGSLALRNSIVSDPVEGSNCSGLVTDGGGNLRWPQSDGTCAGDYADPKLGPLAANGGYADTRALLASSPAIGHGVSRICSLAQPAGPGGVDERGVPHVEVCDSGAYESALRSSVTTIDSVSSNPSVVGQPVMVVFSVAPALPPPAYPTGSVTVRGSGGENCTGTLASGHGNCSLALTQAVTGTLSVEYSGDATFGGSVAETSHTTNPARTTLTVSGRDPQPANPGQAITVSVSVAAISPGAGHPTGSVIISDTTSSCTAGLVNGAGSCRITPPSCGSDDLTLTYPGDGNYKPSVAHSTLSVRCPTTTTITSDPPDPSVTGQPVTVNYSVSAGDGSPSGTVSVAGGDSACDGTLTSGAGSCVLHPTIAGSKTLTATYQQTELFIGSSDTEAHTVNKASTTITMTGHVPARPVIGQPVDVSFLVEAAPPGTGTPTGTGHVSLTPESDCQTPLTAGAGTCTVTPSLVAGERPLYFAYDGDDNYLPLNTASSGGPIYLTVDKADTTTTISSHVPSPSLPGEPVTVMFGVAVDAPGSSVVTGSVTVSDGAGTSCSGGVGPDGSGQCRLTFSTVGAKSLTATYAGNLNLNGSVSAPVTHHVKGNTTTIIASDLPDPSAVGVPVAVQVAVTSAGGTPGGIVVVSDSAGGTCGATLAGGVGQCILNPAVVGTETITATYSGTTNFYGSSDTEAHLVVKATTTTEIVSDAPDPSVIGQSVTVTYTVSVAAPGSGTPTGDVQVSDGTGAVCTGTVAAGQCALTPSIAGPKTLTARYLGDANFVASSGTADHTVDRAATTTAIAAYDPSPSVVGQPVVVTYTVGVVAPGSGAPTGSIQVSDGAGAVCTGTVTAGQCALTPSTAGPKTLTARYLGDANFAPSTGTADHTVDLAATTTAIAAHAPSPSVVGQPVVVTYTVSVAAPGSGAPTGNVQVSDGAGAVCTGTVSAGQCAMTPSTAGPKTLTAWCLGDANFAPSSGTADHTVGRAATTTAIPAHAPSPSVVGQPVVVTYTVSVAAPGSGTSAGDVQVSDGAGAVCTGTVTSGQCALTPSAAGPKTLTARYLGDANFAPSTGTADHTVDRAATTTAIVAHDPARSVSGQTVTVTFTVGAVSPGSGAPGGQVEVDDGHGESCSSALSGGSGRCTLAFMAGAYTLTARYAGNEDFEASASSAVAHTTLKADTTVSITTHTPDPTTGLRPFWIGCEVTVNPPGSGAATGEVRLDDGTGVVCTGTVAAGGCWLTPTTEGDKMLTAEYLGDDCLNGSVSAGVPHRVETVRIYVPLINKGFVRAPDLVIDQLNVSGGGLSVQIRNAGSEATPKSFWVDLYVNPWVTPALNLTWGEIAPYGAAWGVPESLAAGASLTLRAESSDPHYYPQYSRLPASLPAGSRVYAFVDSLEISTDYGAIWESNEHNNLYGPVQSTAQQDLAAPVRTTTGRPVPPGLPSRPRPES